MATIPDTYNHESSENLDAFFSAVGVPWVPRKMMCSSNPRVEVTQEGDDSYRIKTVTLFKTLEMQFKLGEKFEDALMSGDKTENLITKEGDSLIQEQVSVKGTIIITRTFTEAGMDMTFEQKASGVKATRHFKRASSA